MIVRNVRDISPDDKRSLEAVLGEPLRDDQRLFIRVLSVTEPDEGARRAALAGIEETFSRTEAYAREHGIAEQEIDAAVEEAMDQVRRRSP